LIRKSALHYIYHTEVSVITTHSKRCILRQHCAIADTSECNTLCPSYVAVHGHSGNGGRIGVANVPSDYALLTVANSPARTEQAEAYALIEKYIATFPRQFDTDAERIKSFYLYSDEPGTGKTTTASAILDEYIIVSYIGALKRNRQPLQRPAYFLDVNEWQKLYTEFTRQHVPEDIAGPASREYYRQMQHARTAPFAVLDDIGVRTATDGFRGDLHSVINYRVSNGLPTVYTSNVTIADLKRIFDARLADRIRDLCLTVDFVGTSKRGFR